MLSIVVPEGQFFDESNNSFIYIKQQTLQLEHSLVALSKWESKWNQAFLDKTKSKSYEQIIDYIRCMTITQNVNPLVYLNLSKENIDVIHNYIESPMTATTFPKDNGTPDREIKTAEIIYYYMIALNIPFECQKWHLNRLFALIKVCSIKNQPKKKMSKRELMDRNRRLNAERKAALHTEG